MADASISRAPCSCAGDAAMTIDVTRTGVRAAPVSASGTSAAPSSLIRSVGEDTAVPDAVAISNETSVLPLAYRLAMRASTSGGTA
jgi:hypothetical protein